MENLRNRVDLKLVNKEKNLFKTHIKLYVAENV